jgi:hypothetical protein
MGLFWVRLHANHIQFDGSSALSRPASENEYCEILKDIFQKVVKKVTPLLENMAGLVQSARKSSKPHTHSAGKE